MDIKLFLLGSLAISAPAYAQNAPIAHDSELYILHAQNKDAWEQDDTAVDQVFAAFRDENGGNPPNINNLSDEAMRVVRMYTEPSCTPTRVAQTTGRLPVRIGMGDTTVDIAGFGLPKEKVTLAEVLKAEGYATSHVGKWHMGDIAESWAMNQGFDYAQHAVHQQGQLTIFNDDAIREQVSVGIADFDEDYTIDDWFRPDASAMATVIEEVPADLFVRSEWSRVSVGTQPNMTR